MSENKKEIKKPLAEAKLKPILESFNKIETIKPNPQPKKQQKGK